MFHCRCVSKSTIGFIPYAYWDTVEKLLLPKLTLGGINPLRSFARRPISDYEPAMLEIDVAVPVVPSKAHNLGPLNNVDT